MTVRRLLAETDSHELAEWMAFERVNGPLGGERSDFQAALIASTVVNAQRTKGSPIAQVSDFLPEWDPKPPQTWEEQYDIVRALNRALGGTEVSA